MKRAPAIGALCVLCVASAAWAAPVRPVLDLSRVPEWVRQAAAIPAPASDADLAWLSVSELVEPLNDGHVRTTTRVCVKVLKDSGLAEAGRRTVSYRGDDPAPAVAAWTLYGDGKPATPDPNADIVDLPYSSDGVLFEDTRVRTLAAAGVVVGAIVAYEVIQEATPDFGEAEFAFGEADEPTVLSRFELRVPETWSFDVATVRAAAVAVEKGAHGFTATARDLAPLPREELRPAAGEILPGLFARWWSPDGARGFKDWDAAAGWSRKLVEPVLAGAPPRLLAEQLGPRDPADALPALARSFAVAARNVRYVAIVLGMGGWRPRPPADVLKARFGDCKDKATLLRALVQGWGLTTYEVLVRTRELGPLAEGVPTPKQFNHMIAAVRAPPGLGEDLWSAVPVEGLGRLLFLDPTVGEGRAWDLRDDIQGTTALVVTPAGGRLVRLPVQPPAASVTKVVFTAALDDAARFGEAALEESWTGGAAARERYRLAGGSPTEQRAERERFLQGRFSGVTIAGENFTGLDQVDEPVAWTVRLSGGKLGQRAADLLIVDAGRVPAEVLGAPLPPPPRRWPLRLGAPSRRVAEIRLDAPAGWVPESLPARAQFDAPEISFDAGWSFDNGTLVYRRTVDLKAIDAPAERYTAVRDALAALRRLDAAKIVLVRKPAS